MGNIYEQTIERETRKMVFRNRHVLRLFRAMRVFENIERRTKRFVVVPRQKHDIFVRNNASEHTSHHQI